MLLNDRYSLFLNPKIQKTFFCSAVSGVRPRKFKFANCHAAVWNQEFGGGRSGGCGWGVGRPIVYQFRCVHPRFRATQRNEDTICTAGSLSSNHRIFYFFLAKTPPPKKNKQKNTQKKTPTTTTNNNPTTTTNPNRLFVQQYCKCYQLGTTFEKKSLVRTFCSHPLPSEKCVMTCIDTLISTLNAPQ